MLESSLGWEKRRLTLRKTATTYLCLFVGWGQVTKRFLTPENDVQRLRLLIIKVAVAGVNLDYGWELVQNLQRCGVVILHHYRVGRVWLVTHCLHWGMRYHLLFYFV